MSTFADQRPPPNAGPPPMASSLAAAIADTDPKAEFQYRQTLHQDPINEHAIIGLAKIYGARGDFMRYAFLLEEAALGVHDPTQRATRATDLGFLYEEKIKRPALAIEAYRLALASSPQLSHVHWALARLERGLDHWEPAVEHLLATLALLGPTELLLGELRSLAHELIDRPTEHKLAEQVLRALTEVEATNADTQTARAELQAYGQDVEGRLKKLRDEAVTTRDKTRAAVNYLLMAHIYWVYVKDSKRAREHVDKCLLLSPGHRGALHFLERQMLSEKRERELADFLADVANRVRVKDKAYSVELLMRAADIWATQLKDKDEEEKALVRAWEIDGTDFVLVRRLLKTWTDRKRFNDMAIMLESFVVRVKEPALEQWARKALWRIYSKEQPDPGKAHLHLQRLIQLDPVDQEVLSVREAQYRNDGNKEELVKLLETEGQHTTGAARAKIFEEKAELLAAQNRRAEAYEAEKEALLAFPTADRAQRLIDLTSTADVAATRELLERAAKTAAADYKSDLGRVAQEFQARIAQPPAAATESTPIEGKTGSLAQARADAARTQSPGEKVAIFAKLVTRLEADGTASGELISAYQEILALDATRSDALSGLADWFRREENWSELAEVLHRLVASGGTQQQKLELARLFEQRLGRAQDAVDVYLGLLESGEEGAEVLDALERMLAAGIKPTRVAGALAQRALAKNDYARAAELFEQVSDRAEDATVRWPALLALADVEATHLGRGKQAAMRLADALLMNPQESELLVKFLGIAQATQEHALVQKTLQQILEIDPPNELKAKLGLALAKSYETSGDMDQATHALFVAYEANPEQKAAPDTLERLLREHERFAELDQFYSIRVERSKTEEQPELLRRQAELRHDRLKNFPGARETYERLLVHRPGELATIAALEGLLGELKDHGALAKLLEEQASMALSAENRGQLLLRLGAIYGKELALPAEAKRVFALALETPQRSEAIRLLRAFGDDPDVAQTLLPVYEAAADAEGRWHAHRVLSSVTTGLAKADHLRVCLAYAEAAEQHDTAFAAARETLVLESGRDLAIEEKLIALGKRLGRIPEAVDALRRAQNLASRERSAEISLRIATTLEMDDTNQDQAIEAWRQAVAMDPTNVAALLSLERLLKQAGRPRDLVEVLRLRQAAEPARRLELGLELAGLLAGPLADPSSAIAEYQALSNGNPEDVRPWRALADLLTAQQHYGEASHALAKEIELTPESPERRARMVYLGRMHLEALQDPDAATLALAEVLRLEPTHAQATELTEQVLASVTPEKQVGVAELLEGAYSAQNNLQKLFGAREIRINHANDPQVRRELLIDAARLYEQKANDPAAAFQVMASAFKLDPRAESVRAELERLAAKSQDFATLAAEYEAVLPVITDGGVAISMRRRLAELYERNLGRAQDAVLHLKAAAELAGGDLQSLEAMTRLLRSQDNPAELAEVLAKQISLLPDSQKDQSQKLLAELADLRLARLEDKAGAINAYQQIVASDPKNANALAALDKLLSELGRNQELIQVLLLRRDTAGASDLGVELNVRLGDLHRSQPSEALQYYKAALQRRPQNAPALAALEGLLDVPEVQLDVSAILEPLHTAKQDYPRLAKVLEVRLSRAQQLVEKKGLIRRIGDIYENRLNQKDRAFAMALRAIREDPADMGIRMWIEKLAQETNSFRDLADAYVEQAQKAEAALALQFHRRAAVLYYEKAQLPDLAIPEYREVLSRDARDAQAHAALEKLYGQTGQLKEQADIVLRMVELNAGLEKKLELLAQAAALQEQTSDYDGSLATRKRVLQLAPEDHASFDALGALFEKLGRPEEWARSLDTEIQRIADKRGGETRARRLDLMFQKGVVTQVQLSDPAGAAKIFEGILVEEPAHAATIAHLEERVQAGDAAFAAVALERVYQQSGDWRKFVDVLEAQLTATPDHDQRKSLLLKIAQTYQQKLQVKDMAFLALSRAFGEDSSDSGLRDEMERLVAENGNYEELAELYAAETETTGDPHLKMELSRRVAEIYQQQVKDPEKAITWLRRLLELDARHAPSLHALDEIYTATEKWMQLTEVLDQEVANAALDPEKVECLLRLGLTWGDKMFEPEAGIRSLNQARQLAPQDVRVLQALERYFGETKQFDEVAQVLRDLDGLEGLAREERVRVRAALGTVLMEQLRDDTASVDAWRGVIELDPANRPAIETLDGLFRKLERWDDLAVLLKGGVEHLQNADDRIDFNRRLAEVMADHLGNTEEAVAQWNEVLKAEPRRVDALRALIALHGRREEWEQQADMAKRLIPLATPQEGKSIRFIRMSALAHVPSGREDAALIGREILSATPHTPDELNRLADLFESLSAFEDAVKAVDRSVELYADPEDQLKALRRSADLYLDRLNRPTAAVPTYEKILELHPDDKGAFDQVRKILRNAREWRRLVATDEGFVAGYQGDGRLELLEEIRDVHDKELGQKDLAFIAACRVFREQPGDSTAAAMERLAGEIEGYEELSAVYEDVIEELEDARQKIEVFRRLARLYTERMNEAGAAEEVYERLLELTPGDSEALDRLAEIRSKQGRYEDMINALEAKLNHAPDVDAKKGVMRQIASTWDVVAKDVDKAIATHQRILDLDPSDKIAIDNLSSLYARENKHVQLIGILTRAIDLAANPQATVALREKMAAIYEGPVDDVEQAIGTYRKIMEIEPGHVPTLMALERLYTQLSRWRELLEVFELLIPLSENPEERLKLFAKAASVFEEHFEDKKNALICYDNILAIDPNHIATLRQEERLLKETKEWEKLIQVLQHHSSLVGDPAEIVKLYIAIGEIFYRHMARVDKAEEMFNAARSLDPNAGEALNALGKLYERSGNWFQSIEMLQREAEALRDDPKAVDLYYRMGKINENMLLDTGAAKGCYQRALQINDKYVPALAALKEIARNDKDWEKYIEYLSEEADATEDPDAKTELLFEAGRFFQDHRNDSDNAERFFAKALAVTADYLEAAKPLAEIYFRKENWAEAERVLEVVVSKLDAKSDVKELGQKWYRLGYLADKQLKTEEALQRYERAFEIDSTYLPTLEGLGHAYVRVEKWESALKAFNAIIVHHRESLTNAELVDLFAQTGEMHMRIEQFEKARKQYDKALEVEPQHGPSLRAVAEIQQKLQDYESAYDYLSRFVEVAQREERVHVLLSLAQLSRTHLKDPYRAIDALLEAQKLDPASEAVLEALVVLYQDTKQSQKIADLTEQLAAITTNQKKKLEYGLRLGELYHKELKDPTRALKYYNLALDADPGAVKAFEQIEQMLSELGEWRALEENYRAMLARLPATARKAKAGLFRTMAELYREVLKETDNAITSLEVAAKLDPGNERDASALASLYGEKPELRGKAINMQHELLKAAQNPVPALRELRKLYQADKKFDKVFCVCQALVFLKQANEEERKIYDYLKKGLPAKATKPLTDTLVRDHLLHPGVRTGVADLVAGLYKVAPDLFTKQAKDLGLKKKDLVELKSSQLFFVNMFKYVSGALASPTVEIYKRSGSMADLDFFNARPPALAAGEDSPVFKDASQKVLCFHIARNLMYARPELFLARAYPGEALQNLLVGFIALFNPKAATRGGDEREIQSWMEAFRQVPEQYLRRVKDLAIAAYNDMKTKSVAGFSEAVEYTAFRGALLLTGDLDVVARTVGEAAEGAARIPPDRKVRDLVMFSVSEDYYVLRENLGLAIKG